MLSPSLPRVPSLLALLALLALATPLVACGGTSTENVRGQSSGSQASSAASATPGPSSSSHSASTSSSHSASSSASGTSAGLPDGGCRTANDCEGNPPQGALCAGPVSAESTCLALATMACTSDSQCQAGEVCRTGVGAQPIGSGPLGSAAPACRPPCASNADCNFWESCADGGHCSPLSCADCPSYLSCPAGACGPTSCTTDGDCPGGFCVDATCYGTLGTCEPACE